MWYTIGILASTIIAIYYKNLFLISAVGFIYFSKMLYERIKFNSEFGKANYITLIRLCLIMMMGLGYNIFERHQFFILATINVVLDILDGYVARKFNESSQFGFLFDLEVDSLFVLISSLLIYFIDDSYWIVLIPGVLRYFYKLIVCLFDKKNNFNESKQKYASLIAGNYFVAILVFLLFYEFKFLFLYICLSSLLIFYSFTISFLKFYKWTQIKSI